MAAPSIQSRVTQLPPVDGIIDPQARAFLASLVNLLDQRSGTIDANAPQRFVTLGEINGLARNATMQLFAPGVVGGVGTPGSGGPGGAEPTAGQMINKLAEAILSSYLFEKITEPIRLLDIDGLRSTIDGVRQHSEAGISQEAQIRSDQDTALARAVNTIWAAVGDNTAVIEDGTLASAGTTGAVATKWTQVQAALTDPSSGLVVAAAARQDFNAYVNNVDGKMNALYTLRLQLSGGGTTYFGTAAAVSGGVNAIGQPVLTLSSWSGNPYIGMYVLGPGVPGGTRVVACDLAAKTIGLSGNINAPVSSAANAYSMSSQPPVVGGFGVAATQGSASVEGGSIDFGVVANRFYIAAPLSGYDPGSAWSAADAVPFIVVTTPTVIDGITFAPGTYLKKLFVADATIDNAKIANAAVGSLKIAGNAVTVPSYATLSSGGNVGAATDTDDFGAFGNTEGSALGQYIMPSPGLANAGDVQRNAISVSGRVGIASSSPGAAYRIGIFADGVLVSDSGWASFGSDFFAWSTIHEQPGNAMTVYQIRMKSRNASSVTTSASGGLLIVGTKR